MNIDDLSTKLGTTNVLDISFHDWSFFQLYTLLKSNQDRIENTLDSAKSNGLWLGFDETNGDISLFLRIRMKFRRGMIIRVSGFFLKNLNLQLVLNDVVDNVSRFY